MKPFTLIRRIALLVLFVLLLLHYGFTVTEWQAWALIIILAIVIAAAQQEGKEE